MKKLLPVACCGFGAGMMGAFANRLDTTVGAVVFTAGVAILVLSVPAIFRQEKKNRKS